MTIEEFKQEMSNLLALSNTPETMAILNKLEADYSSVLNDNANAIKERDDAIADKQKYAELNNQLWLASHLEKSSDIGQEKETVHHEEPPKLMYSDLDFEGLNI